MRLYIGLILTIALSAPITWAAVDDEFEDEVEIAPLEAIPEESEEISENAEEEQFEEDTEESEEVAEGENPEDSLDEESEDSSEGSEVSSEGETETETDFAEASDSELEEEEALEEGDAADGEQIVAEEENSENEQPPIDREAYSLGTLRELSPTESGEMLVDLEGRRRSLTTSERRALDYLKKDFEKNWPGPFWGLRASFGGGFAIVPRYGQDSLGVGAERVSHTAPYLGLELGMLERKWGASIDASFGMSPQAAEFLSSPPMHLIVSANLIHRINRRLRISMGFNVMSRYWMSFPSGQTLVISGMGYRMGLVHHLSTQWRNVWEGFFYLSADRFSRAESWYGKGASTANDIQTFTGSGKNGLLVAAIVGVQYSMPW